MEYLFNFKKIGYLQGKRPKGCILCLVRDDSKEVEKLVVHETEHFIVSINLYPYNPGHLIVFPKRHIVDIREYSDEEEKELDKLTKTCLEALDKYASPSAYNIGYNMGLSAGASIEHLHMHIIPRYPREIGIVELIAGSRVLVQDPKDTLQQLKEIFSNLAIL
ncbi:MAG TPA: HIT domain-containing protein [Rectinema sp.]|jgi:ATP adenylyltransferase|nr:HIT domain-containing protein [Spirochaetia bacterium]HAL93558.1 histidine triad (HIT) protein [Spirochaetaceae bacterium]HNV18177.1 HIT domain-containing protein [Rectinema sp.]HOE75534.1 HIT domain-containing protein [Rectinema sp.]HOH05248.1 HIT domain-containing protein [Rectinema sp.]